MSNATTPLDGTGAPDPGRQSLEVTAGESPDGANHIGARRGGGGDEPQLVPVELVTSESEGLPVSIADGRPLTGLLPP